MAKPPKEARQVPKETAATIVVRWTELGEERRALSEHGLHKAGDLVETEHAAHFISNGFAEAAD